MYRYKMKSTGHSSAKFGACEVCGNHVSEVFYQTEFKKYSKGWSMIQGWFGHKECLERERRSKLSKKYCG